MNLLSSVKMGSAAWSGVLRLPAVGLKFSIINTEAPAALLAWYKAESAGKGSAAEAAVVRKILENKGLVVRESSEETELMPAILSWNEKNKQLCVILAENDDKEEESSKKWSDQALMNKYGKITAIGIEEAKNGGHIGGHIQKIRARCLLPPPLIPPSRYGREEEGWSQWREVFD